MAPALEPPPLGWLEVFVGSALPVWIPLLLDRVETGGTLSVGVPVPLEPVEVVMVDTGGATPVDSGSSEKMVLLVSGTLWEEGLRTDLRWLGNLFDSTCQGP